MKDFSRYDIAEVIADEFDLLNSDVQPTDRFLEDYEADGFDMMNLCANLETRFDIKIPPETEKGWATVQDVYIYMEAQAKILFGDEEVKT